MLVNTVPKSNGTKARLMLAAMTLVLAISVPVFAQEMNRGDSTQELKVPETANDHLEMAKHYQKIEAQNREDIEMHKKMLADFTKTVAANPKAGENPYSKQMRLHCAKYDKAAEAWAREAGESAKFHILRAKELEGK